MSERGHDPVVSPATTGPAGRIRKIRNPSHTEGRCVRTDKELDSRRQSGGTTWTGHVRTVLYEKRVNDREIRIEGLNMYHAVAAAAAAAAASTESEMIASQKRGDLRDCPGRWIFAEKERRTGQTG